MQNKIAMTCRIYNLNEKKIYDRIIASITKSKLDEMSDSFIEKEFLQESDIDLSYIRQDIQKNLKEESLSYLQKTSSKLKF